MAINVHDCPICRADARRGKKKPAPPPPAKSASPEPEEKDADVDIQAANKPTDELVDPPNADELTKFFNAIFRKVLKSAKQYWDPKFAKDQEEILEEALWPVAVVLVANELELVKHYRKHLSESSNVDVLKRGSAAHQGLWGHLLNFERLKPGAREIPDYLGYLLEDFEGYLDMLREDLPELSKILGDNGVAVRRKLDNMGMLDKTSSHIKNMDPKFSEGTIQNLFQATWDDEVVKAAFEAQDQLAGCLGVIFRKGEEGPVEGADDKADDKGEDDDEGEGDE